jgi:hypothetical protein
MKSLKGIVALCALLAVSAAGALEPFFDDNPATRHAPPDPELTDLDLDVLILCGGWGEGVEARDFERMMLKAEHRETLARIRGALGSRIYGPAPDDAEFVRQLRRAWFEQKGFAHVFCGEPGVGRDLGGLHYAARFWQAEDEGWAGYRALAADPDDRPLEKCRQHWMRERLAPPVYTIGIEFVRPGGAGIDIKCVGGYHREMHAERILVAATRAFKQANRRAGRNATEACLYQARVDGVAPHYSQLVIRSRAIRTFYPLAEDPPYCREDRNDYRACLCSRLGD